MINQKTITKLWEERSQKYGREIEGVLPKSLPKPVNLYLDQWMFAQTKKSLTNGSIRILDLGCGYGRISKEILDNYPNSETVGLDISESYVNIYNQDLKPRGKAVVGNIQDLNFPSQSFDAVIIITTLIYLNNEVQQNKCIKEILRVIKPGGKFVIIERNTIGSSLITAGGLLTKLRGKQYREIPSVSFSHNYLYKTITKNGGVIESSEGIPFWTLFLPISLILSPINNNTTKIFLSFVYYLDKIFAFFLIPSLYISYVGHVKNNPT